jgi:hypothetical protein
MVGVLRRGQRRSGLIATLPGVPNGTRTSELDRSRDLPGWVLTPLVTLVLGPALATSTGVILVLQGGIGSTPVACEQVAADNGCEELTLGLLGGHAVGFGLLWLLLWLMPWWRGLRAARIWLAVVACVVLIVAPLRMAGVI